uniref:Uncharacterized protein n=1 Tax=Rhizophora mucronata TaxID=61149 RepID=A0A2P2Q9C3_RHIMU
MLILSNQRIIQAPYQIIARQKAHCMKGRILTKSWGQNQNMITVEVLPQGKLCLFMKMWKQLSMNLMRQIPHLGIK